MRGKPQGYATLPQVAAVLGVEAHTLRRAARDGKLPWVERGGNGKVFRVNQAKVRELLGFKRAEETVPEGYLSITAASRKLGKTQMALYHAIKQGVLKPKSIAGVMYLHESQLSEYQAAAEARKEAVRVKFQIQVLNKKLARLERGTAALAQVVH